MISLCTNKFGAHEVISSFLVHLFVVYFQVVIRNVRQFLNGIKNYLVKHGEGELHELIESERTRLNANEFLNIDAILEAVLHKIVLCEFLYAFRCSFR